MDEGFVGEFWGSVGVGVLFIASGTREEALALPNLHFGVRWALEQEPAQVCGMKAVSTRGIFLP